MDWHDGGQSRVCCRPETALSSLQAGDWSCAGGRSSVVTKVEGHALVWCGKTRYWFCRQAAPSQSRRDGWNCTAWANTGLWLYNTCNIRETLSTLFVQSTATFQKEKKVLHQINWEHGGQGQKLNNNISSWHSALLLS